jgi:hypothetical protein
VTDPFRTPEDYELFLYTLAEHFPSIRRSTLTFIRRGQSLARITGELHFDHGFRLVVLERLVFDRLPVVIDGYATKSGMGRRSSTGMIRNRIPTIRASRALILITSTYRPISSTTGFRLRISALTGPICRR